MAAVGAMRTTWAGLDLEHDPMPTTPDAVAAMPGDIVLPPTRTTETLATLMMRRPVRRALDIGTGCGALALLAARFSDEVIATDVNARALALTEINAARNGVDHVRCLEGGLTEPISFERFGLILANLPFVISPPNSGLAFRDGAGSTGGSGGNIAQAAIADAASVLESGGFAQLLVNWIVTSSDRAYDEPVEWVEPTGCDGLILLHSLQSPEDYVDRWATTRGDDRDAWLRHLSSLGAEAVANGAITIRARPPDADRARPPRIRTARMTTSPRGSGGEQIARIIGADRPTDAQLLGGRTVVSPHSWADAPSDDGETRRRLVAGHTCGVTAVVSAPFDRIIDELDGSTGLDEVVRSWADRHGVDDRQTVHGIVDATIETVRRLVSTGLATVEPVSR